MFSKIVLTLLNKVPINDTLNEQNNLQDIFPESMKIELFKMLGSLALVLSLFGVCLWIFKRVLKSKGQTFGRRSTIKVLDRRALNQKTTIYIIKIIHKTLIIAESGDQVTLLSEFPPHTDLQALLQEEETCKANGRTDFLRKSLQRLKQNQDPSVSEDSINNEE